MTDKVIVVLCSQEYKPANTPNSMSARIWFEDRQEFVTVAARQSQGQAFAFEVDFTRASRSVTVEMRDDALDAATAKNKTLTLMGVTVNGRHYQPPAKYILSGMGDSTTLLCGKPGEGLPAPTPVPVTPTPVPVTPTTGETTGPTLTPPPKTDAGWADDFTVADASRFVEFDGSHWPPVAGSKGKWARCYYYGWPTNSGSQDPAARCLRSNKEAQSYEDRAVALTPEGLTLTATRDSKNSHGFPWTSGAIVQHRDFARQYGRFEMVAKLPDGKGFWPAFWLLSADMQWPPEIDVVEKVGLDWDNKPTELVFRHGVVGGPGYWPTSKTSLTDFHSYACEWSKDSVKFFFDGVQTFETPTLANMHKPMYMLANLAVGGPGSWPGEPDPTVNKAVMTIKSITSRAL